MVDGNCPGTAKRISLILLALLALIALQSLFPLFQVGLVTNDDLMLGNAALDRGLRGVASVLWWFTRHDGRLDMTQVLSWYLPFAVDSFVYFKAVSVAGIVADLLLFALFARSVLGDGRAFFMALLLSLVGLQNSWEHTPLTAFPGLFTFTFAYLLGSFLAFQRFLAGGGRRWLALSTALFVLTLCSYEMYILYAPVLFGLALLAGRSRREALRTIAPHLVGIALYLTAYLTSHALRTGNYAGVTIAANLDLLGNARVLWQFSVSSLPAYFFFAEKYDFLLRSHGNVSGLEGLIEALNPGWLIKAALVGGVYTFLMTCREGFSRSPHSPRRLFAIAAPGALYFFAPSALPALTVAYREQAKHQLGMQFSYFSLFAWVWVAVALLLLASRGGPPGWRRWLLTSVTGLGLVSASLVVDYTNGAVAEWQAEGRDRVVIVDELIATPVYAAVPEGSFIYAPSLWRVRGTINFAGPAIDPTPSRDPKYRNFWTFCFNHRGRKRVVVTDRLEEIPAGRGFFYLRLAQLGQARTQYIVFAWVDRAGASGTVLVSDHVTLLDRSAWTSASVGGALADRGTATVVSLAGGRSLETTDRFLFDVGRHYVKLGRLRRFAVVAAGQRIDAESVFLAGTAPGDLTVRKGSGWYQDGWIGGEARAVLRPDGDSRVIVDGYAPDYVFRTVGIDKVTVTLELDGVSVATQDLTGGGPFRLEAAIAADARGDLVVRCGPLHKPLNPSDDRRICAIVKGITLLKQVPSGSE